MYTSPAKPFVLKEEEGSAQKRKASDAASRGNDHDSRRDTLVKAITAEAIMVSIEAKPSDSRMVNLLYSFRAQADALGALGIFDDDRTALGRMLHEETGGHDALIRLIDEHIATERDEEARNVKPNMNAYMRTGALFPEALPYAIFDDDEPLRNLENRRIKAEIEASEALERVIDDVWKSEDAYDRINEEARSQNTKLQAAEVALMEGVIRAIDEQLKTSPLKNPDIGRWELKTDDTEYGKIAVAHQNELSSKRARREASSSPGSSSYTEAVPNVYGTLPPLPSVVTGTPFEDRQKKMAELKQLFSTSETRVLEGGEFENNTGGICGYVSSFAKYARMWTYNNPLQATLTAVPIALGAASAAGVAAITAPAYMTALVGCETLRGIHKRQRRGESLLPPAIQRVKNTLSIEDANAKWLLELVGTLGGGTLTYSLGNAARQEWKLLQAILQFQNHPGGWQEGISWLVGGYATGRDSIADLAQKARKMSQRLALNPADQGARAWFDAKNALIERLSNSSWDLIGGEWVRDGVDYVWRRGGMAIDLVGPVLLVGSTAYKAVSFVRDGYRPDRARLYLYCNDPENDVQKPMLENMQLAREVLPILYDKYRGDKMATWEPLPYPTIKAWMPKLTDTTKPTQEMTSKWRGWYAEQVNWDDKSTDEIINAAKNVHLWKKPIVQTARILKQKFVLTAPMWEAMKTLRDNWTDWSKTWRIINGYARRNAGLRPVNWLAGDTPNDRTAVNEQDLSRLWFKLYSVLKYQHAYIIGGIDPSRIRGGPEKKFDARATAANRPSFVTMIDEIQRLAGAAKRQSELPHNAERSSVKLEEFDDPTTRDLETLFEKYYPGFADLAKEEAKEKKKKKKEQEAREAQEAAAAAGQPPPQPAQQPAPDPPLNENDIEGLFQRLNVPNPGLQPDEGDGPIDEGVFAPLVADGPGAPGPLVQASVVDEVYARVSALRL